MEKSIRILLVDDSLGIRLVAKKLFHNLGYNALEVVEGGVKALELLESQPFDLAIIDWSMPEMSGLELLEAIRERPAIKDLPVLLVTAIEEPLELIDALKAGADSYMNKPYDATQIEEKIAQVFEFRKKKASRQADLDF
ncbi:MAG: hypothetical protein A2527_06465 [Candidatus Lambdaproteobacteria bacterium RIFOXYD2_FULL_50_16]|uniref:Response regulatory domain-containing protein n=1 Tax=Candidatus Lambdaproteobacteria bacterium RIFOXYD2_FULL_50_16 TaxID=1817772 RepID=A0A1F6GA50_9PROT|nr:MAG: hypothetical protein A2527_06465 [Candidatus Lambdaproteobacteria bacterium RIFOXYD2_FULL_50_16]